MSLIDNVRATLKSSDTEGAFELYVTRTPGYLWALFFKALHVHPIAVTLMSIVMGVVAGPLMMFDFLHVKWPMWVGIFLLIWANWYDCADGQLARMTGKRTLIGRILDGFAGDLWFFSIYFFLSLRLTDDLIPGATWLSENFDCPRLMWGWSIWLICAWAGFRCHGRQNAVSDYYRNIHMWMQLGRERCELDTYDDVTRRYHSLKWLSGDWFEKLYLFFYAIYCEGQENQAPEFLRFYRAVKERWGDRIPERLRQDFRAKSLPLMPWTNILTFDFRVGLMIATLIIGQPWIWPLFELSVMEYWRYRMRHTHEAFCADFTHRLAEYDEPPSKGESPQQ